MINEMEKKGTEVTEVCFTNFCWPYQLDFHLITNVTRIHREQTPKEKISSEPLLCSMVIDVIAEVSIWYSDAAVRLKTFKKTTQFHITKGHIVRLYIIYF